MNAWLALSIELRCLLLAVAGAVLGSLVNCGIYSLAWFHPRSVSPWSAIQHPLTPRHAIDYFPIAGWMTLRRESIHFGTGHWIRPLLIELAFAIGLPLLYRYEISGSFLPVSAAVRIGEAVMHAQFISHVLLIALMTVATFIDFDEQTIPDSITIPGVLAGLTFVTWFPGAFSQVLFYVPGGAPVLEPLWFHAAARAIEPLWIQSAAGLLSGLLCFAGWCYALVPKTVTLRRGWWKGLAYLHASTFRTAAWWKMGLVALSGSLAIFMTWSRGGEAWSMLLTSLLGMAFGGGMIWSVRLVGFVALRKEAMGFGDVTLMCMIGAFLGWQASLFVFFLAPLAAVFIALTQWLLTGRRDVAFGPYLCAAALLLMLNWRKLWEDFGADVFSAGWLVLALLLAGLLLMMGLLMMWRIIEEALFRSATSTSLKND